MVGLEIIVKIRPDKRLEFLQAVEMIKESQPAPGGCVRQTLYEKVELPNTFLWAEDWRSGETLASHLGTEQFKTMVGAINVLGTLEVIRQIIPVENPDFDLLNTRNGMGDRL